MPNPAEMAEDLRRRWYSTLKELFEALMATFPECTQTQVIGNIVGSIGDNRALLEKYIKEWHESMAKKYGSRSGYECCEQRDAVALGSIPILQKLNFSQKWNDPTFDDASRDVLWSYIDLLNDSSKGSYGLSTIQGVIPDKMMEMMASKMGQIDPANMDMGQAVSIASEIGNSLTAEEMQNMMAQLPHMMSSMSSLMPEGNLPPELASMMSGAGGAMDMLGSGNIDMGAIAGMMGGMDMGALASMLEGGEGSTTTIQEEEEEDTSQGTASPSNK